MDTVTVEGNAVTLIDGRYTFTNVQSNTSLSVTFKEIETYIVDKNINSDIISDLHYANLIAGQLPIYISRMPDASTPVRTVEHLTDGVGLIAGAHATFGSKDRCMRILYDLGASFTIESLLIAGINSNNWAIGKYELYITDNPDDWDVMTPVIFYDNTVGTTQAQKFDFKSATQPRGRYVGLLVTDVSVAPGEQISRLSELGVYGIPAEDEPFTIDKGVTSGDIANWHSTNLIAGKTPIQASYYAGGSPNISKLTDGEGAAVNKHIDFWNIHTTLAKLVYDLGQTMFIDSVMFASCTPIAYTVGAYRIFITDNLEGWEENVPVIDYDNNDAPSAAQLITFAENKKPSGRYVCFMLYDGSIADDDNIGRISELGVYG